MQAHQALIKLNKEKIEFRKINLILDKDSPCLELMPLAGMKQKMVWSRWYTPFGLFQMIIFLIQILGLKGGAVDCYCKSKEFKNRSNCEENKL